MAARYFATPIRPTYTQVGHQRIVTYEFGWDQRGDYFFTIMGEKEPIAHRIVEPDELAVCLGIIKPITAGCVTMFGRYEHPDIDQLIDALKYHWGI